LASATGVRLFSDWKAAELLPYTKGGRGFGMINHGLSVNHWIERFADWVDVQGLLKPAS